MTASEKRVGIRDVAKAAGLSITTVSFALNGKGQVAEATRQRVRDVAKELGYQPNQAARSLKSGRSRIIGIAVSHRESRPWRQTYLPYYRSIIAGAAIEAVEHGHAVAAIPFDAHGHVEAALPFDGLIVVDPVKNDPTLAACVRDRIPVVVDGRPLDEHLGGIPGVQSDVHGGMGEVLSHYASREVTRPALLTGSAVDAYTLDTERSFRAWCRRRGLPSTIRKVKAGEQPLDAANDLLDRDPRVDAVHALNQTYGEAVLAAAAQRRLSIPEDLVVTMMGESASAASGNGVSYLVLDPAEVGATCVRMLVDLLDGKAVTDVMLPCRFVVSDRDLTR